MITSARARETSYSAATFDVGGLPSPARIFTSSVESTATTASPIAAGGGANGANAAATDRPRPSRASTPAPSARALQRLEIRGGFDDVADTAAAARGVG